MLDIIYKKFKDEIFSIENYIKISENSLENCINKCEKDIYKEQNIIERKNFYYRSLIVSISSTLEFTVDNLIFEYLKCLNKIIENFDDLPKIIRGAHLEKSLDLAKNLAKNKYRFLITQDEVIRKMNSCIEKENYDLNIYAILDRTSNYRFDSLQKTLQKIGIENFYNQICTIEENSQKIKNIFKVDISCISDKKFKNKTIKNIFNSLDILAFNRNKIAHSIYLTEILGVKEIKDILEILKIICDGLYQILKKDIFNKEIREKIKMEELIEIPTAVKTKVIGDTVLELKNIEEGYFKDKIYSKKNNKFQEIKILKIIKHSGTKEEIDHIKINKKVVLTIEFDQKISKTNELYMYK